MGSPTADLAAKLQHDRAYGDAPSTCQSIRERRDVPPLAESLEFLGNIALAAESLNYMLGTSLEALGWQHPPVETAPSGQAPAPARPGQLHELDAVRSRIAKAVDHQRYLLDALSEVLH